MALSYRDLLITRIKNVYHTTTSTWSRPQMLPRETNGLVYLETGSITYFFENKTYRSQAGNVLVLPKGVIYCGQKNTELNSYYVIDFHTDPENGLTDLELPYLLPGNVSIPGLFIQCEQNWISGSIHSKLQCRSILYAILSELMADQTKKTRTSAFAEEILIYLQKHYTDPELCVRKLSTGFHLSESQMRRLFQQTVGMSPMQYILSLRLELAQNLLMHDALPVSAVASRCGFTSESYFSRIFKQRIGVPPSRFR